MDIYEFALEKEKHSEQTYRDLASRTDHEGLRNILTMLADEEVKHYHTIEQMKAHAPVEITQTSILDHARETFDKMRKAAAKFNFQITEAELYRKAAKIEEESKRYYLEKADQVDDASQKDLFRKLAEEENKHQVLVENIANFVERPETYLENAEFYHFNDYVGGQF